jgi:hypothetical protein
VGGQVQNWLFLPQFVVFVVEHFHLARVYEVHLLYAALVADDCLARLVDTAIKADD